MFIVNHRKFFFILAAVLVASAIAAFFLFGFNLGIDFKGGSIVEVSYQSARPTLDSVKTNLDALSLGDYVLTPSGTSEFILKSRELSQAEQNTVLTAFNTDPSNPATVELSNTIGPSVGNEMESKALYAIGMVILCIVLFITFAFRKVSQPVSSWKYGFATIVALAHDVLLPAGFYVAYIHFHGGEIDLLFVTALLAILGYSVHDTIVVFDRVREHLRLNQSIKTKETFAETVGKSVSETFGRSINTSLTIFLALLALFLIGGQTTKDFALVLIVGIIAGTYSSIFIASPLLVTLEAMQKKN
jgi:preprotein translocase subunit SecF